MENLLKELPRDIESLKEKKLLEPIKIKMYGEEIIAIINEVMG